MPMPQLNANHARRLARPNPGDAVVALRIVRVEKRLVARRPPHSLVSFVPQMERSNPRRDRMLPRRRHEKLAPAFVGRGRPALIIIQEIPSSAHFLPPPRPFLVTQKRMMQHQHASSSLYIRPQILLSRVIQIPREVI